MWSISYPLPLSLLDVGMNAKTVIPLLDYPVLLSSKSKYHTCTSKLNWKLNNHVVVQTLIMLSASIDHWIIVWKLLHVFHLVFCMAYFIGVQSVQMPNYSRTLYNYKINRIYNKILDRDWFSACLFVMQSARDHVGVQLQVSDLNFLWSDTCNWISTWFSRQLQTRT